VRDRLAENADKRTLPSQWRTKTAQLDWALADPSWSAGRKDRDYLLEWRSVSAPNGSRCRPVKGISCPVFAS